MVTVQMERNLPSEQTTEGETRVFSQLPKVS